MGKQPAGGWSRTIIFATFFVVVFVAGLLLGRTMHRTTPAVIQTSAKTPLFKKGTFSDAIVAVAQVARPSVVHIDITGTIVQQPPSPGLLGMLFGFPQGPRKIPIRALGSGVLLDKEGYIITNNHVVEHAQTIKVLFYDGTEESAQVVGRDPISDLAVVKVKGVQGMPPATLGDSNALKVGEWVVAIGSPRGLDWTVTAGIISAKHRTDIGPLGPSGYEDFLQTDAAINPGNSGGPLLNLSGEVIGINSLIVSATQGSEGLGFAVPSNMIKVIAGDLIKEGRVVRGAIGISFQDLTPALAQGLNLSPGTGGEIVVEVVPDGPAAKAGVRTDDVITGYDGDKVDSAYGLRSRISSARPGSTVRLTILRDNNSMEVSVKVEDQSALVGQEKAHPAYSLLGVKVEPLTTAMANKLGLSNSTGVVITDVVPGSPADSSGLKQGDVIFRVDRSDVSSARELSARIDESLKTGLILLLIYDKQSGRIGYVQVPV